MWEIMKKELMQGIKRVFCSTKSEERSPLIRYSWKCIHFCNVYNVRIPNVPNVPRSIYFSRRRKIRQKDSRHFQKFGSLDLQIFEKQLDTAISTGIRYIFEYVMFSRQKYSTFRCQIHPFPLLQFFLIDHDKNLLEVTQCLMLF